MDPEKVSRFIKELRKKEGLTQKDLASKYNVTYQAVSKWETAKNIPDIAILKQMCEDYNLNLDESVELFEEGMKLSKQANEKLENTEKNIQKLQNEANENAKKIVRLETELKELKK